MRDILKEGFNYSLLVAMTGAIIGGIAGWVGLLSHEDLNDIAKTEVQVFYLLIVVIPIVVVMIGYIDRNATPERYQTLFQPLILCISMGGIGAIFACGLFFIVAVNVPAIFAGVNSVDLNYALRERIFPQPMMIVCGLSLLFSAGVAGGLTFSQRA